MSNKVGQVIIENSSSEVSEKFDEMSWDEWKDFHQAIRKCGHFAEFLVLGVLMYLTLGQTTVAHKLVISFVCCMLVGAMDETIQLFVAGRSGRLTDVLLDSCGGLVGIWMAYLIVDKFRRGVQRRI